MCLTLTHETVNQTDIPALKELRCQWGPGEQEGKLQAMAEGGSATSKMRRWRSTGELYGRVV